MIIRPCANCKTTMHLPPSKGRQQFCSLACRRAHKHTIYTCATCGKQFEDRRALAGRKRYCSRECKNTASMPLKIYSVTCTVCGKRMSYEGSAQRKRTTCSRECANKARTTRKPTPKHHKPCAVCGKTMKVFPSRNTQFCSRECAAIGASHRTRSKRRKSVEVSCAYCGKRVIKPQSRVATYGHAFCDKDCYHAWDAAYKSSPKMIERLADRLRDGFGKPSGLETRVANWLEAHGIPFDRQVLLKVYLADFKVGNTYVEVQGCYWHGCLQCNTVLTPLQKRRAARDKSLHTYCQKRGIRLIAIWEHDIDRHDFSALTPLLS